MVELPILAGPVFRARDTAELAFGASNIRIVEGLTADDYAGRQLAWVLREHRRLMVSPVPAGLIRVLVGHRTPAIMVLGDPVVGGRVFPEGAALILENGAVLGVLEFAPLEGGGWHGC